MRTLYHRLKSLVTGEITPTGHSEQWISGIGAAIGIGGIYVVSSNVVGLADSALLIASMGASAVLLFAVPHSPLSQPWPLLGGNLISCAIGVTCARYIPLPALAAALAVGGAITVMYYLRCLHPPGGATALVGVIGGDQVHALGYQFVATPVLINLLCIITIAIAFNYPFVWRRYPAELARRAAGGGEEVASTEALVGSGIAREDLLHALEHMESYIDVSEEDLERIYTLAAQHADSRHLRPEQIALGRYYSNGAQGPEWAVRRIVDESGSAVPEKDKVIYRGVAGKDRRTTATCTRAEFARWAKYEVVLDNNSWKRIDHV